MSVRGLVLRRERLAELTAVELDAVAGGGRETVDVDCVQVFPITRGLCETWRPTQCWCP